MKKLLNKIKQQWDEAKGFKNKAKLIIKLVSSCWIEWIFSILILYSPVLIPLALYYAGIAPAGWLAFASAAAAFWAGPFTPFWPLTVVLATILHNLGSNRKG